MWIGKKERSIIGITVLLFFAACSVEKHYKTLSFFFDGVPNPEETRLNALADSLQLLANDSTLLLTQTINPELYIHEPYREKKCNICHDKGRMGSLNQALPNLCYQCHNNLENFYPYKHGPAAGGYCMECHDPHKSKEEKLLTRQGNELCFHCHDAIQVFESVFHDATAEMDCISCHNPHGGYNHNMLQQESCYQCHDNYNEMYCNVHGPVASGNCSACHVSHNSGTEKLLKSTVQDLCLYCHDSGSIFNNEFHKGVEVNACTDCHNPHGGDDRLMLN